MAKIKTLGDTLMVSTDLTKNEIETAERHVPEALTLKNEEGSAYFSIAFSNVGNVSKYGVNFNCIGTDGCVSVNVPNVLTGDHSDTVKERFLIEDKYASVLFNLIKIEAQVRAAIGQVREMIDSVSESIEIG